MKIEMAVLCDFAAAYGDRFFIQACYDVMEVEKLPYIKKELVFALRIFMEKEDEGLHQFGVNIVDADGIPIVPERMPFLIDIDVKKQEIAGGIFTRNYVFNCFGLQFNSPGEYSLDLTVDGTLSARIPFRIIIVRNLEKD